MIYLNRERAIGNAIMTGQVKGWWWLWFAVRTRWIGSDGSGRVVVCVPGIAGSRRIARRIAPDGLLCGNYSMIHIFKKILRIVLRRRRGGWSAESCRRIGKTRLLERFLELLSSFFIFYFFSLNLVAPARNSRVPPKLGVLLSWLANGPRAAQY